LTSSFQLTLSPSPERAPSRQTSISRLELSLSPEHPAGSFCNPRSAGLKRARNSERAHKKTAHDVKAKWAGQKAAEASAAEASATRQKRNGDALVNVSAKQRKCDEETKTPPELVVTTSKGAGRLQVEAFSLDGRCAETDSRYKSHEFVRERLAEALGGNASKLGVAAEIAAKIDDALHDQLGEKEYFAQARAILFNLKAVGDGSLKQKLLDGKCDPKQLPKMKADGLANDTINSARETARRKSAEANTIKPDAQYQTDLFTCGVCSGTHTEHGSYEEMRGHGIYTVCDVTCLTCGHVWTEHSKG
jgi:hypothetical protein